MKRVREMHASVQDADQELYTLKFEDLKEVALLGRGSSGVVRKVHHGPTGKDLVLKVNISPWNHCLQQ